MIPKIGRYLAGQFLAAVFAMSVFAFVSGLGPLNPWMARAAFGLSFPEAWKGSHGMLKCVGFSDTLRSGTFNTIEQLVSPLPARLSICV